MEDTSPNKWPTRSVVWSFFLVVPQFWSWSLFLQKETCAHCYYRQHRNYELAGAKGFLRRTNTPRQTGSWPREKAKKKKETLTCGHNHRISMTAIFSQGIQFWMIVIPPEGSQSHGRAHWWLLARKCCFPVQIIELSLQLKQKECARFTSSRNSCALRGAGPQHNEGSGCQRVTHWVLCTPQRGRKGNSWL